MLKQYPLLRHICVLKDTLRFFVQKQMKNSHTYKVTQAVPYTFFLTGTYNINITQDNKKASDVRQCKVTHAYKYVKLHSSDTVYVKVLGRRKHSK